MMRNRRPWLRLEIDVLAFAKALLDQLVQFHDPTQEERLAVLPQDVQRFQEAISRCEQAAREHQTEEASREL